MPSSPNAKITPQEMMSKAQTIAQAMMQMSDSQRHSELVKLKNADAVVHSLVKEILQQTRREFQQAGGQQLMAQQFGGGR